MFLAPLRRDEVLFGSLAACEIPGFPNVALFLCSFRVLRQSQSCLENSVAFDDQTGCERPSARKLCSTSQVPSSSCAMRAVVCPKYRIWNHLKSYRNT